MAAERRSTGPLRSAAFRFAFLLALVFAGGSVLLLATVQRQIGRYAVEATGGTLRNEAAVLAGEYGELGLSGLTDAMERHGRAGHEAQFRYLLLDAQGRRLFGDLPDRAAHVGWGTLPTRESDNEELGSSELKMLGTQLPDGLLLVVATDNFDVDSLRKGLGRFTMLSGIGITLFALLGGYVIGRLFLRRLASVNNAVDRIVDGDSAGRLPNIGFGHEFDDLTHNLNRMLDRNAAAMEALRQVSTDIAHDLRTPLSRLHQSLETIRETGSADPEAIDDALEQTSNLLGIFHALLRIGTVEGGFGRQRFQPVDLSELLDRIHSAYDPVAEDAAHILTADHAPDVIVDGDGELLAQMFTNLIENAIVHTPPGTTIGSRLRREKGVVVADIFDNGPGIPIEERAKVFRRFYRLDASRHSEGAGLGLALVAAVALLHNAEYSIVDEHDGLCVRISFPAT